MEIPGDLRYTKTHEWVRVEGELVVVGITAYAAENLADIVLVSLPKAEQTFAAGDPVAEVESVKSVEEIYAPVSGTVAKLNQVLMDKPQLLNDSPYAEGWIFKLAPSDFSELDQLLSAEEYKQWLAETEGA